MAGAAAPRAAACARARAHGRTWRLRPCRWTPTPACTTRTPSPRRRPTASRSARARSHSHSHSQESACSAGGHRYLEQSARRAADTACRGVADVQLAAGRPADQRHLRRLLHEAPGDRERGQPPEPSQQGLAWLAQLARPGGAAPEPAAQRERLPLQRRLLLRQPLQPRLRPDRPARWVRAPCRRCTQLSAKRAASGGC